MKEYQIKYEDYDGEVHVKTIVARDRQSAVEQLICRKEVYWVRITDKRIFSKINSKP